MDMIERAVRERARNFYYKNNGIKTVKLVDLDGEAIKCNDCNNIHFKLYTKFGGEVRGKRNKIINCTPITYNFVCKCGNRIILKEGQFKYGKIKYGCSAGKCPFGKKSMDKECLRCKYLYEK